MQTRINREKLTIAMLRRDMTQKQLAELSGASIGTVNSVKGGKSCSKETANKLAAVLGTEIIEKEA